jgi:cation transport regulator ChaC
VDGEVGTGPGISSSNEWVFGYGSLVAEHRPAANPGPEDAAWARIHGFRRAWNIAMRNVDPCNDRKFFIDALTLERIDIHVTFTNLVEAASGSCSGVLIPVSAETLRGLDEREANYRRVDVTDRLSPRPRARAWTYLGLDDARARFRQGRRAGNIFVPSDYLQRVEKTFRDAGPGRHAEYLDSTDPVEVPVRDLRQIHRA